MQEGTNRISVQEGGGVDRSAGVGGYAVVKEGVDPSARGDKSHRGARGG